MEEKATIYDYARICQKYYSDDCVGCPLAGSECGLDTIVSEELDNMNEKILNWVKEHPVKTRQDKFLEMFPNAKMSFCIVNICPTAVDDSFYCSQNNCYDCKKSYWLAEVEE